MTIIEQPVTTYPQPHHVVIPFRTITPDGRASIDEPSDVDQRRVQQVRSILIDGMPLCLPMDGLLKIEPMVGGAGHHVTVEFFADDVLFEPNPDL